MTAAPPSMTLLAVDATAARCAALVRAGGQDVLIEEELTRGHDARLAPMAGEAMARAGIAPRDLERVVAATGPGSFTGVRLGVAFARGLSLALGAPAVGVSCLDALAASARRRGIGGPLVVAHDARRGEVVWRAWSADGSPSAAPALSAIAEAAAAIDAWRGEAAVALVGTGAPLLAAEGRIDRGLTRFDMADLADLGARADPARAPASPFYHRPPDAKLPGGRDPFAEPSAS